MKPSVNVKVFPRPAQEPQFWPQQATEQGDSEKRMWSSGLWEAATKEGVLATRTLQC